MRKLIITMIVVVLLFTFTGCIKPEASTITKGSYASMIIYNNTNYYLSVEVVPGDEIDKQIGEVLKQVEPVPQNDGESNECPAGTKIYSIKGEKEAKAVAVYFRNEYRKATILKYVGELIRLQEAKKCKN